MLLLYTSTVTKNTTSITTFIATTNSTTIKFRLCLIYNSCLPMSFPGTSLTVNGLFVCFIYVCVQVCYVCVDMVAYFSVAFCAYMVFWVQKMQKLQQLDKTDAIPVACIFMHLSTYSCSMYHNVFCSNTFSLVCNSSTSIYCNNMHCQQNEYIIELVLVIHRHILNTVQYTSRQYIGATASTWKFCFPVPIVCRYIIPTNRILNHYASQLRSPHFFTIGLYTC